MSRSMASGSFITCITAKAGPRFHICQADTYSLLDTDSPVVAIDIIRHPPCE